MNTRDFRTLFGVTLRRQRFAFAAWIGSFCLILAILPNTYRNNLGSMKLRASVIEMMDSNAATRLLFGRIPHPGTLGQVIQWESGMLISIFTAIAAILIVTAVGRRSEDDGLRELIEGTGVSRTTVFAVQAGIGATFSLGAGVLCGLTLAAQVPLLPEISVAGTIALALAISLVGCAFSAVALIVSQLADDAVRARRLFLMFLLLAFALRIVAEASGASWMRWLTPLGWKEQIMPFVEDRFIYAIPAAAIGLALTALAWRLYSGRELHGAYLRSAHRSTAHLHVGSIFSLAFRLGRYRLVSWSLGIVSMAAFVGSMAGSFVTLTKKNPNYEDLMTKMSGGGDTSSQIVSIFSVLIGILLICESASAISSLADTEKRGILDAELASGASRRGVIVAQALTAMAESAILAALGAVALSVTVGLSLDWESGRDVAWQAFTQWPAAVCLIGVGCLFYAISRRLTAAAWALVGWSFVIAWFGGILNLPKWLLNMKLLGWSFSPTDSQHIPQALGLLAIGIAASALATIVYRRRDILTS